MRIHKCLLTVAAATAIVCPVMHSLATEGHEVLQKVPIHGHINWSQGIVFAKGSALLTQAVSGSGGTGYAVERAKLQGQGNLLETVKAVRIDASSMVTDLMEKNAQIQDRLQALVRNARIAEREYLPDGSVELMLTIALTGAFAELVLPDDVKHVPEIRTLSRPPEEKPGARREPTSPNSGPPLYTGLVIDARGLAGQPAMCPRVVAENGEEVYGATYVSREFAVLQGTAAYGKDLEATLHHPRVSDNALIVRALRTVGPSGCDFLISNTDASKIRSASENLAFLKKCRVVIVLEGSETQCLFLSP